MRRHIRYGNTGKARINVLRCVMSDHIAAYQVPEDATYKCIRWRMLPSGHSGYADRRSKSVDTELGQLIWIFGCYHSCERPASDRMARWKAIGELAGTTRPESPCTVFPSPSLSDGCHVLAFRDDAVLNYGLL